MDAPAKARPIALPSTSIQPETIAMRPNRVAVLATLLFATAAHANAGKYTRYLELINHTHDSVTSLSIADPGSDAFREMTLGPPLSGGGGSTMVEVDGENGCRYDLRFTFRNGRALIYQNVDVCRYHRVRIQRPRIGNQAPVRAERSPGPKNEEDKS